MTAASPSNIGRLLTAVLASYLLASVAQAQSCPIPPTGNPTCGVDSTSQSSPNPSTGAGNPIDLTSGNKYQAETDIQMPGDLAIGFRRHYNSLQTRVGVLGKGWSHTYETQLSRTESHSAHDQPSLQITLIQGDGRQIRFEPFAVTATARRYRSIPAGYGLIEEDLGAITQLRAPGANRGGVTDQLAVWKWVWSNGQTLTFNGRGLLKTIARPDGRSLQVQFDAQHRMTRVTDGFGNWLAATYWDNPAERLQSFNTAKDAGDQGGGYRGRLKALTLSSGDHIQYQYDTHGSLTHVVYADHTVRRYEYDGGRWHDLLTRIFGRDGQLAATYEYDASGYATRSSHPDHRDDVKVSYEWPKSNDNIGHTTVESTTGEKTVYTWHIDAQTQLPSILKADGPGCRTCATSNVRYEYDSVAHVTKTIRVDNTGAPIEQVVSSVDELGRTRSTEISHFVDGKLQPADWRETRDYDGDGLLPTLITRPSVVPGRQHTLRVEYNEHGQPTRIIEKGFGFEDPQGLIPVSQDSWRAAALERVTVLTYKQVHGMSLLHTVDGPLAGAADTWTYQYDTAGRLRAIVHPGDITETFTRDAWGRVKAHVGVDGVHETLEYDTEGNIQHFARGDSWMTLGYDAAGRIATIRDSLGQQLTLKRNDTGELVQIGDAAGNRIRWNYGEHGEVRELALLNPDGSVDQRTHAGAGDPVQLDTAIPNEAMLSAIAKALPDEVAGTIPGMHTSPAGSISTAPAAEGSGAAGLVQTALRTAYDAQGRATQYVYDDFGRMTAEHSPVSGTTRYRWDPADHLIERVASDGSETRITRDALGRAIRVRAGPEDGRIEWGPANRPTRVTYQAGEERFEYDTQARLTAHVMLIDGKKFRVSYEFDSLGRIARKHLPDGSVLHYKYNGPLHAKPGVLAGIYKEGLLERPIVTDLNTGDEQFANRGFTFGNGLSQRRVLDIDGRVLSDGNPKVGQSHLQESATGTVAATYTRTASLGGEISADSMPSLSTRLAAQVSEFGAAPHFQSLDTLDTAYSIRPASFDARGQLIEDSERHYEWDALGRLTRVSRLEENPGFHRTSFSTASDSAQQTLAEYRYNLFGERIAKLANSAEGPKLTYFFWDGSELAAEMDQSGQVLREYVYLDSRPVALLSGRAIYWIHTDHRLAPVAVTNSDRRLVWQANVQDNGAAVVLAGSQLELPLRASNQYFDAETGLHYNVHRYLDARRGRYLSPDPMGLAAGPDVYQFALGQPHTYVDLLGLQSTTDWSKASYTDKLVEIIKRAVPLVPGEIGNALQQLIQPANLAVMGAIFAAFAAAQATPVGWIADAAILGYSAWSLGSGLTVIIDTLLQLNTDTKNARCDADLTAAAKRLAAGFVSGTGQVASGLLGVFGVKSSGGVTRIANGITTLVDYAKSAFNITEESAVVIQGSAGYVPPSPPLTQGLGGTVPQSRTGIVWATAVSGIKAQGLAFEDYAATQLASGSRLPPNFKTWDFYDPATRVATSAKTLNTLAPGYSSNPSSIYSALKGYLDAMSSYSTYTLKGVTLNAAQIGTREMQLAVPAGTTAAEWTQILKAVNYASSKGMKLIVTVVQ